METPADVLIRRLGNIRDNGDIDFDHTAAALDIDIELQQRFVFIPYQEIEAVEVEHTGDRFSTGSGPEECSALESENPAWLFNHAINALAMWQHLTKLQERMAKRPEPGVYLGRSAAGIRFTVIVTDDRRILVPISQGGGDLNDVTQQWDDTAHKQWTLQRIDTTTGTITKEN